MSRLRLLAALVLALLAAAPAAVAAPGWSWPLPAPHRVVRGLDLPAQPWQPGHRGVDLAGAAGEVVRAAGDGVVVFAGEVAGVGVVSLRHAGGLVTTYQPVAASVHRGEAVRRGEPIGRLTRHGSHCSRPCLHWGLRRGADYLDPLALVGAGRVRLLPLGSPGSPGVPALPAVGGLAGAGAAAVCCRRLSRGRRSRRRRPRPSRGDGRRPPARSTR